jgi:lantibiotic modifying enzyme
MKTQEETLPRIARYLILHGSFSHNMGLLNGKTGIAIFFYHYARYAKRKIYGNFADELIDEIYSEIHRDLSYNFKDGLCGIAWGIDYLIKNNFVEADADEILEDLDKQITERDVRRITDYSLETGLKGIAYYVIGRKQNRKNENVYITMEYIMDLAKTLAKNKEEEETCLLINVLEKIIRKETIVEFYNPVCSILGKIRYDRKSLFEKPRLLGIADNGYAGIGLQLMKIDFQ